MKLRPDYRKRVREQRAQYADMSALKRLPPIYRYWVQRYLQPKVQAVFSVGSHVEIYASAFTQAATGSKPLRVLSIGAGDGQLEVAIAEKLEKSGVGPFRIVLTELSEIRMERAKRLITEKGLLDRFSFEIVDVNDWEPDDEFDGVMAHHTLHHIVELEGLFDSIRECLSARGRFVVIDMIGRNGHMRWPETLEIVERFWRVLPERYKFNHQFGRLIDPYDNWDCSKSGFEGIRSEDILPLLCERFSFAHFLGVGGVVDVFVERGYGHNFDPEAAVDRAWIDIIASLNDALLDSGEIKPTMAFAITQKQELGGRPVVYRGLSPQDAIRWP